MQKVQEIQIGLLGLGTVSSGVIEIIRRHEVEWQKRYNLRPIIKKIVVQNPAKPRLVEIAPELITTDYREILADPEIDVVVEVMGGEEPALSVAKAALNSKKHLVTANKKMLALHGPTLYKLALRAGVELAFEGSVGGGIPIIQPLRESLNSNEILELMGIINGTTNYILTSMEEKGEDYRSVLRKAMELGYAEADPTSDVEGFDACYKLSVLTAVAFGQQVPVEAIPTCGISTVNLVDLRLAAEMGYRIKLVAKAVKTQQGVSARVHPTLIPFAHPLAGIHGVNNALWVKGDAVGEVMFTGPGAGMMATGSAVVSDLLRICRRVAMNKQSLTKGLPEALNIAYREAAGAGFARVNDVEFEARNLLEGSKDLPGIDNWAPKFVGEDAGSGLANCGGTNSNSSQADTLHTRTLNANTANEENSHFFISIQTTGRFDADSLTTEGECAGIPIYKICRKDDLDICETDNEIDVDLKMNYFGVITHVCGEKMVQRFVENLKTKEGCCRSCYYFIEGGEV